MRIQKLLVPFDKSDRGEWALYYAAHIAEVFNADLHVIHINGHNKTSFTETPDNQRNLYRDYTSPDEQLEFYVKELLQMDNTIDLRTLRITGVIREDNIANGILNYIDEASIDMVVIGSGRAEMSLKAFGLLTEDIIERSDCPVLSILPGTRFCRFKNIAFASDFQPDDIEKIARIESFAEPFAGRVHCIHVFEKQLAYDSEMEGEFKDRFIDHFSLTENTTVLYTEVKGSSIKEGLEDYIRRANIELLCMNKREKSWHKGLIKSILLDHLTPVLILK